MEYKIILGYATIVIQILSYVIYFRGILKGETKPHAFTWLVWSFINVIAFAAVVVAGGGIGATVLAINALACLAISVIGFKQKRVDYDLYDWWALIGGLIGTFLWWLTKDPLYAVILVSLSDAVGSIPTLRKAYYFPFEENALSFGICLISYPLAILALENLNLTTYLYPVVIILVDIVLLVLILVRRRKIPLSTLPN